MTIHQEFTPEIQNRISKMSVSEIKEEIRSNYPNINDDSFTALIDEWNARGTSFLEIEKFCDSL